MERKSINEIMYQEKESDVVFIQPHLLSRELKEEQDEIVKKFWNTMHKYAALLGDIPTEPNHGIYYMAASLLKENYSVEVLDFHALDQVIRKDPSKMIEEDDIEKIIKLKKAKVFGISSKTVAIERAIRIAEIIKENHPDSLVVLGGLHPTLHGHDLINGCSAIDIVARGDGEQLIVELMENANNERELENVSGILYRGEGGEIKETERVPVTKIDIDNLPFPAYQLVAKESQPLVPRVLSARGCPHKCAFCSITSYYDYKVKLRSPKVVVDEIQHMVEEFQIDFYCLGDLTFMINRNYCKEICDEIISRGLEHIKWWCQTTVGRLGKEDLELMSKAGCVQVALGVEGGNQDILDLSNKPAPFAEAEDQCKLIKEAGISVQTYWLIGMGGETVESALNRVEEICYFIQNELADATHISVAVPFPGTQIWDSPEEYGYEILHKRFGDYWMNCDELGYSKPAIKTPHLSADHIYMFWKLALTRATREFEKRFEGKDGFSHFKPKGFLEPVN